ncbi:hypothetical protein HMPREF1074_04381, partial [Bacteroides xylanisolvens CL03T12C04]
QQKTLSLCTSRPQTTFIEVFFYWDIKPVGHMRMGKPYDLVFTTKIVAVLTFLFTGRKKSVFLYTFASSETFHLYICWILKRKKIKMETEELTIGRVHHGRNIRRTRIEKNMNQEGLSELVHLSQPAVSKYEKMKVIDDEMLQRFARALNVPFDYLKTLEEDAQTVVFENNTVNNSEQSAGGANISMGIVKSDTEDSINDSRVNNFNPIDKITELYERLLKEKDEKYAALERRLQNIEKSLQK